MAIRLEPITEDNCIEAFHLQLAEGQEKFVPHPIRSLAQAYIYQGCGYAQNALNKCLEYIGMKPFGDSNRVVLTCSKENSAALHIYKKAGFSFTGQQDEEELEMVLYL